MWVYDGFEGKYLTYSCIYFLISHFIWLTDFKYDIYIMYKITMAFNNEFTSYSYAFTSRTTC